MNNIGTTRSLDYISEMIHSICGVDPYIIGINAKMVYNFQCQLCNHQFQIMILPNVELITIKNMWCDQCKSMSATLKQGR